MTTTLDRAAMLDAVARHRLALADLVDSLVPDELDAPSLCAGWTVREVAAHVATAKSGNPLPFVVGLAKALGRPDAANRAVAAAFARRPVAEITATIRAHARRPFVPPGVGLGAPLADALIHTGDIVRPLHRAHDADAPSVGAALDFVVDGRPVGFRPRGRLVGLVLVATDLDRRWNGTTQNGRTQDAGSEVRGRGLDLLLAVCGRAVALDDLAGDGVATLRARL